MRKEERLDKYRSIDVNKYNNKTTSLEDLFWNQRKPSGGIAIAVARLTIQMYIMHNTYLVAMLLTLWHLAENS